MSELEWIKRLRNKFIDSTHFEVVNKIHTNVMDRRPQFPKNWRRLPAKHFFKNGKLVEQLTSIHVSLYYEDAS